MSRDLAQVLTGSWRREPPPLRMESARFEALLLSLIGSGAGALAWRRARRHSEISPGEISPGVARELQAIYMKQALDARLQQGEIQRLVQTLRAAGIEPMLIKGWATARLYPEIGLRATGDIDILVAPADKNATSSVLGVPVDEGLNAAWDIKSQVPALYGVDAQTLLSRRENVLLGDFPLDVLCPEDHLRVLCLHFLKHGAWRPLWLCDIAAALEARPDGFDWQLCLGDTPRIANAIAYALGLAHHLLGASLEGVPEKLPVGSLLNFPLAARAKNLPRWLAPAVLRAWETPQSSQNLLSPLLKDEILGRQGAWRAVLSRWPNPIQAAIEMRLPLSCPPLLSQCLFFAARSLYFARRTLFGAMR